MSWRARAVPVGDTPKSSWRDKAVSVPESSQGPGSAYSSAIDWLSDTGEGKTTSERVESGGYPAAIARQFAAGYTGGWNDEASGLIGDKNYASDRNEVRLLNKETKAQYPVTSFLSNLAGSAVGIGKFKSLPIAGGLVGLGESDADLTKGDPEENTQALRDTIWPALFGQALHNVGSNAAPALDSIKTWLASRHIRLTPAIRRALGKAGADAAANEAIDSGAIKFGRKIDDTADNLKGLVDEVGAQKQSMVDAAQKTIDPREAATRLENEVLEPATKTAEGSRVIAPKLREKIAGFKDKFLPKQAEAVVDVVDDEAGKQMRIFHPPEAPVVPISAAQMESEKTLNQGLINYKANPGLMNKAEQDYARVLKEMGEGLVDDPNFIPVKQRYGNLKTAQLAAERTASLTDGGGLMGHLTDLGVGHVALEELMKANPKGMALLAARGLVKGRASSAGAVSAKVIADMIRRGELDFARNIAPKAAAGAAGLLSGKDDE